MVFTICMLFGCESLNDSNYGIIKSINSLTDTQCLYYILRPSSGSTSNLDSYMYIRDSCGQYSVNDTIYFKHEKRRN